MVQSCLSSTAFLSWNKCLRHVWDLCSQRHSLSPVLQELIYKSNSISCLDTTRDSAGAQNPEMQPRLKGLSVPSATAANRSWSIYFLFRNLRKTRYLYKKQDPGTCAGAPLGNVQALCLPVHRLLWQNSLCSHSENCRGKHSGRLLKPRAVRQHLLNHLLQSLGRCSTETHLPLPWV